jgi:LysR family transcriptional regulator, mexEF-oprN operon transcriptional activator
VRGKLTLEQYFAHEHIIVSYNGDLRGVVEDTLQRQRRVRCSVSSFTNIGALVEHTSLLATIPDRVARELTRVRPALRTTALPFPQGTAPVEMFWPTALADDEAMTFLRAQLRLLVSASGKRKT